MTTLTIGFLLVGALIVLVLLGMQIAYALFLVAFAISRYASRPIEEANQALYRLSRGDYSLVMSNAKPTEFKQLANHINRLAEHFLAHAFTQCDDFSGNFQARQIGSAGRRGVITLALEHVGPVHTGGGNADQHLTLLRARHRSLGRFQRIRPARLADLDAGHGPGKVGTSAHRTCPFCHISSPPPRYPAGLLTYAAPASTFPLMTEPDEPRPSEPLTQLLREDLDPLSVTELDARIAALHGEIARCEAKKKAAVHHRASADALFKR